jgi:hypothetical protein
MDTAIATSARAFSRLFVCLLRFLLDCGPDKAVYCLCLHKIVPSLPVTLPVPPKVPVFFFWGQEFSSPNFDMISTYIQYNVFFKNNYLSIYLYFSVVWFRKFGDFSKYI